MNTNYLEDNHKWRQLIVGVAFIVLSALIWVVVNNGAVSAEDGFDPVRYEYFAREGLNVVDIFGQNYNIVLLLQFLYKYLPAYWGYILFAGTLMLGALSFTRGPVVRLILFSPIAFYFFGQTSKDWLSIVAVGMIAALVSRKQGILFNLWLLVTITLTIFIRPQIVPILILTAIFAKWGLKQAIYFSFIGAMLFFVFWDPLAFTATLDETVQQEQSGELIKTFRAMTFGYDWLAMVLRFAFYMSSPFYQPILGFVKYFLGSDHSTYVLFELACVWWFFILVYKNRVFKFMLLSSIPFSILLAAVTPFYHFRYLLITYPAIYAASIFLQSNQKYSTADKLNH